MMNTNELINSFAALKRKQWYRGPAIGSLDEMGQRLYYRSGDLAARLCLNGEGWRLVDENRQAACTLFHAERYLADRLAYALAPWPKGMMKFEPADAYALPERR
jgi:hypothetical protein